MRKRIIIGILTLVMGVTMLTGCSAFTHNYERDYKQVVAEIKAYDIEVSIDKEDGGKGTYTKHVEPKNIYKLDLVEFVANNQSSLSQSATSYQDLYDTGLEMLINTELIVNEADALIEAGKIKWGLTQENAVKQRVYSVIDSTLLTLKNEILTSRDKPTIATAGDGTFSAETTYPTKPETVDPDDEDKEDTEVWIPAAESEYPGNYGDSETRSLDKEAIVRFIALLKSRVKDDFRLTDRDKELFEKDDEEIQRIIDTDGVPYVYPYLGESHYVYYISGKSIERSQKLTELQDYFSEDVNISPNDVLDSFQKTLNTQMTQFAVGSAYDSAVSGGQTILYRPNNNYFYVKHILLQFSDAQKKSLENYKKGINVTDEMAKAYRAKLAENIVCYPHLYGEDDKSRPMSVNDVMNAVKATMLPLRNDHKAADAAFDDLIYLYNADPGAFNNSAGYVLKYKLGEGDTDQWVEEFAAAARKLHDENKPGEVLYEAVVTDFGVHIMYYASLPKTGAVSSIYEYTTPGETETYYDVFEEPLKTAAQNNNYQKWENEALTYSFEDNVTVYEKRYENLWKDR